MALPLKQRHPSTCSLIPGRPPRPISAAPTHCAFPASPPPPAKLTGVTSSADAFISNCNSVVYWLSRNGGFCLGAPHKRGFALILTVFSSPSAPYSLSRSRSHHSPVHARPPLQSTPHVLRVAGKRGRPYLGLSLSFSLHSLCFISPSILSSSSFPTFPSSLVSRKYVSARSAGAHYDSFHYHTIIFCRHS